jgi:hypothetical protein
VIVLVLPAGIVAVLEAIVIVFLVDAAMAITLQRRIVSSTEAVSLMWQEVVPVQLTRTLTVVPEVVMCLTVARPHGVAGIGVAAIGVDWPLLARWVVSPV